MNLCVWSDLNSSLVAAWEPKSTPKLIKTFIKFDFNTGSLWSWVKKKNLLPHTEWFALGRYLNAFNAVTMESNKDEAHQSFTRRVKQTCHNKASCSIQLLETGQVLYHAASHSAVTSFSGNSVTSAAKTLHYVSLQSDKTLSESCRKCVVLGETLNECLQFSDSCVSEG